MLEIIRVVGHTEYIVWEFGVRYIWSWRKDWRILEDIIYLRESSIHIIKRITNLYITNTFLVYQVLSVCVSGGCLVFRFERDFKLASPVRSHGRTCNGHNRQQKEEAHM